MSTVSASFAEVYVMKKVYKEKMKKMENAKDEKEANYHMKNIHKGKFESGGGCFPAMFKRIHSNSVQNSDSAENVRT